MQPPDPRDKEAAWLADVYQGDQPQLTARALAMGTLIGAVMCLSNLYVSLKLGLALGVAVTTCLLAHAGSRLLSRLTPRRFSPLSMLETNTAQSVASSAGYATGGTIASAMAAYVLVTGKQLPLGTLLLWTFLLSALGVFLAVPMKRRLINLEELPFPTGTAAAETLRSLHAEGKEALRRARALFWSASAGGAVAVWRDGFAQARFALPRVFQLPGTWGELSLGADASVVLLGAGALIGLRTALSMAVGAVLAFGLVAPWARAAGGIGQAGPEGTFGFTLWAGAALLTSSALADLLANAGALRRVARRLRAPSVSAAMAAVEVPPTWLVCGALALGTATAVVARSVFGIPLLLGALAVLLSFALCAVACRVTGETDATPSGPLGQITQLTYGVLMPQNVVANLMTASVTGNTACAAADLLSDLKSGWLIGANPRRQFLAQLLGCVVGTAVVVPFFLLLIPDAGALGGAAFPAPAAAVLASVARLLSAGVASLHWTVKLSLAVGTAAGATLSALERLLPARLARALPSPAGLGLAFLLPASSTFAMLLGAAAAVLFVRRDPEGRGGLVAALASGLIAGESVVGIALALLAAAGLIAS